MKNLLDTNTPITIDILRQFFHENDFSTMPVKAPSEYTEDELELYNKVLKFINSEWREISKTLGLNHPQDCYSKDFPPKLIRDRMQRIVADQVIKISNNDKALTNIMEEIIFPQLIVGVAGDDLLFDEAIADKALHNTVNALMQTLDIESLAKTAKEFSCSEDFNSSKALNSPKQDHNKKWNHTRSKIKTESLDELLEEREEDIPQQDLNIESMAITNVTLKEIIDNADEQEKRILKLLAVGRTQSEIANELGVSQGAISKKLAKIRNTYKVEK